MCLDTNLLQAHVVKKQSLSRAAFLTTRPLDVLTGRLGCTLAEEAPSIIALEGFAINLLWFVWFSICRSCT